MLLFWWKTTGSLTTAAEEGLNVVLFHFNVSLLVCLLSVRLGRGFLECIREGLSHT